MFKKVCLIIVCLICLTGCSVDEVNNMTVPSLSADASADGVFPPSVYEYEAEDTPDVWDEIKDSISDAWDRFWYIGW